MQYNDTTNKSGLLQHCEYLLGFADAAITGNATRKSQFTAGLNRSSQRVFAYLLQHNDEWDIDDTAHGDYPVLTTATTTNRDYTLPASEKVLKIKKLWVSYDGTNYYEASPFDSGESGVPQGNDTTTDSYFSRTDPRYDIKFGSLWLYPKAENTSGFLRIEWTRELDEFTTSDTTQEPGWLDEAFHPVLSALASYEYALVNLPSLAPNILTLISSLGFNFADLTMDKYYGSKTEDRDLTLKASYVDYS